MSRRSVVARVGKLSHAPKTRHTLRIEGAGENVLLPPAQALLLEIEEDGSAQIYRYTVDGEPCGDTWHENEQDALDQLAFEYGSAVAPWVAVPPGVGDSFEFVASWARRADDA